MATPPTTRLYRFGFFEADVRSGELRRKGVRVRLAAQPFDVLLMLLESSGAVLSREEMAKRLWPDGTFVDFDQGVNSAVNRVREALGDSAANPRFVETLARRGYRFVAPVERVRDESEFSLTETSVQPEVMEETTYLATPAELPPSPHALVRVLFLLLQVMYFGFYIGLLFNLAEANEMLATFPRGEIWFGVAVVTAAVLIPARVYLLSAFLFRAPRMESRYFRLWPFLLVLDELWSLAPFLLLHHISMGVALACTALLVYTPFAQRSLVLMGAGRIAEARAAV